MTAKSVLLFIAVFVAASGHAFAAVLPPECSKPSIKRVFIRISAKSEVRIPLRYEARGADPHLPTIVIVPAGPGNRNIFADSENEAKERFLPSSVNVIALEYRGVGCNAGQRDSLKDTEYSLLQAADDFNEVIRQSRVQKYFLFASGHGTAVARIMASRAVQAGVLEPQSLILSDAVGRAWKKKEHFKEAALVQWDLMKSQLSPRQQRWLSEGEFFSGPSKKAWGNYFFKALVPAWTHPGTGANQHQVIETLNMLSTAENSVVQKIQAEADSAEKDNRVMGQDNPMSRQALCRELSQTDDEEIEFSKGKLKLNGKTKFCDGIPFSNPYDAAKWPVGVNQYIIQGGLDPLAPKWQVDYLLATSRNVDNSVLWGIDSGHESTTRSFESCRMQIWDLILSHRRFNPLELNNCQVPFEVDYQQQD